MDDLGVGAEPPPEGKNESMYSELEKRYVTSEPIIKQRIINNLKAFDALPSFTRSDASSVTSRIHISKEAKNLNPSTPYFVTHKTIRDVSVPNDAEIKILETATRRFGKQSILQIHTDRITCEYCQETIFRNNHGLKPYIKQPDRLIDDIQAYSYLLYPQEGLNDKENFKRMVDFLTAIPANQPLPGCERYR